MNKIYRSCNLRSAEILQSADKCKSIFHQCSVLTRYLFFVDLLPTKALSSSSSFRLFSLTCLKATNHLNFILKKLWKCLYLLL